MEEHLPKIQWEHTGPPVFPTCCICMAESTLQSQFSKKGALQCSHGHTERRRKSEHFLEAVVGNPVLTDIPQDWEKKLA